jgi:hypothetical protein
VVKKEKKPRSHRVAVLYVSSAVLGSEPTGRPEHGFGAHTMTGAVAPVRGLPALCDALGRVERPLHRLACSRGAVVVSPLFDSVQAASFHIRD